MPIIVSTEKSKEFLKRLIRNEFDNIDLSMDYIYKKSEELIDLAYDLGLTDLAIEMKNDKE